jgi:hypothetical protein
VAAGNTFAIRAATAIEPARRHESAEREDNAIAVRLMHKHPWRAESFYA